MASLKRLKKIVRIYLYVQAAILGFIIISAGLLLITKPHITKLGSGAEHCPFGHTTIKIVPVEYGLPHFGPALDKRIKNHDVDLGGCNPNKFANTFDGYCEECGYTYSPASKRWTKSCNDPTSFLLPFYWPITKYPLTPKNTKRYWQAVYNDHIINESLSIGDGRPSDTGIQQSDFRIKEFLRNNGVDYKLSGNSYVSTYTWKLDHKQCSIEHRFYPDETMIIWIQVKSEEWDRLDHPFPFWYRPDYETVKDPVQESFGEKLMDVFQ